MNWEFPVMLALATCILVCVLLLIKSLRESNIRIDWRFAAMIPGTLALMAAVFIVVLLVIRAVWAWTIPDLFPGAVEQGLIAKTLSWYTAFKLAVFVAVLAGISGASAKKEHKP